MAHRQIFWENFLTLFRNFPFWGDSFDLKTWLAIKGSWTVHTRLLPRVPRSMPASTRISASVNRTLTSYDTKVAKIFESKTKKYLDTLCVTLGTYIFA